MKTAAKLAVGLLLLIPLTGCKEDAKSADTVPPPSANAKPEPTVDPNDTTKSLPGPQPVGGTKVE